MDFVFGGGGGGGSAGIGDALTNAASSGLGHDNGPILYSEPNRTPAVDDIRSVVIYVFIVTIFFSFFLILPGIRNEKFPTFFCITTSLLVTSIIFVSLFGTTWHVGHAPNMSAAYKAFSRDRIQGELSVRMGLQSVNISLRAHKYYILHEVDGPIIMDNTMGPSQAAGEAAQATNRGPADSHSHSSSPSSAPSNLADDLLDGRTSDGGDAVDAELEADEPLSAAPGGPQSARRARSSASRLTAKSKARRSKRQELTGSAPATSPAKPKFTIKRVNVDINYNERFYWIEPNQMRQEYHSALERGLPYPILTVVEYLSQDEAGFSWSRQYRLAGYYSNIILWFAVCVCILMFCLHCAAPKYGIYTMQVLGCLLLFTNLTYATLVPRGDQRLVIPFEGQSLTFEFGWNFWLVLIGGCLSLTVGTLIVIIDQLFPNFIFTTVLDVDFDSQNKYYKKRKVLGRHSQANPLSTGATGVLAISQRPKAPALFSDSASSKASTRSTLDRRDEEEDEEDEEEEEEDEQDREAIGNGSIGNGSDNKGDDRSDRTEEAATTGEPSKAPFANNSPSQQSKGLFVEPKVASRRPATSVFEPISKSEIIRRQSIRSESSVVEMGTVQDELRSLYGGAELSHQNHHHHHHNRHHNQPNKQQHHQQLGSGSRNSNGTLPRHRTSQVGSGGLDKGHDGLQNVRL